MPAIDVTLSDGDVGVDVQANVGYSDAQARNALDGETVTPGQVGTASDPVDESHTTVQHSQEVSVNNRFEEPSFRSQIFPETEIVGAIDDTPVRYAHPDAIYSYDITVDQSTQYSTDGGDTWQAMANPTPTDTQVVLIAGDSIFAATQTTMTPMEVYRADFSGGVGNEGTWSKVLTGQSAAKTRYVGGRNSNFGYNPNTGTILIGEYTSGAASLTPKIYRSTDGGQTWTDAWTDPDTNQRHVHCVARDPYVTGTDRWIASLGDAEFATKFLESTDDGATWTLTDKFGFTYPSGSNGQATGIDFGPDHIYFADDYSNYSHGVFCYERATGEVKALFSTDPGLKYQNYLKGTYGEFDIVHDRGTGITYVTADFGGDVEMLLSARYIGDEPTMLKKDRAIGIVTDGENIYRRRYRHPLPSYGGGQ